MSVGSVLKNVAGGVAHAGVGLGKQILNGGAPSPDAAPPGVAPAPAAPAAPVPFELPALDPNDPDYEEKKANHDAWKILSDRLTSSAQDSGIDTDAKYKELSDYIASRPQEKKWSPFSSFAIAMGSPAGAANVQSHNESVDAAGQKREDDLLQIKEQALKGSIAQAMEKGQMSKALLMQTQLADVAATQSRVASERAAKQRLAEIQETNKGRIGVANIRASSAGKIAQDKLSHVADLYKLSVEQRKAMLSFASHYISGLESQRDAAGEPYYTQEQLDSVMHAGVAYAEEHSPLTNPPAEGTTPAAPAANPAAHGKASVVPAGPAKNDAVAAAFAARRAARVQPTK